MRRNHLLFRLLVLAGFVIALIYAAIPTHLSGKSTVETAVPSLVANPIEQKQPVYLLVPAPASAPKSKKVVALTFDDGPDGKYTGKVLDILREQKVKGTFFVIGERVKQYPEVLERIVSEGHALGNHSWSHRNLAKISEKEMREEITKTDEAINEVVGFVPVLMRPPYGAKSDRVEEEIDLLGHAMALWNVDPRDWDGASASDILETVKSGPEEEVTILMHSSGGRGGDLSNTIKALPEIIDYYKSNGYVFVTVPELKGLESQAIGKDE